MDILMPFLLSISRKTLSGFIFCVWLWLSTHSEIVITRVRKNLYRHVYTLKSCYNYTIFHQRSAGCPALLRQGGMPTLSLVVSFIRRKRLTHICEEVVYLFYET